MPLIARHPGLTPAGLVSDALVELTDLPATCLAAAGLTNPATHLPGTPGRSLLDHWRGGAWAREEVLIEDGGQFHPAFAAIRDRRWMLALYHAEGRVALYDLEADPHETHDLADDPAHAAERSRLLQVLAGRLAALPPPLRA